MYRATDCRRVLSEHGLRCTQQRQVLFSALMQTDHHPTADELFQHVRRAMPGLSLATVYNTLEAFTKAGMIRRIAPGPGEAHGSFRYDADLSDHVHLVTRAGEMRDVPMDVSRRIGELLSPEIVRELERAMGVSIGRVRVELVEGDESMDSAR